MKGIYTILLLIVSNVFMTFAWYGHLKMKQEYSWFAALPLIGVIAFSWAIAFFEYTREPHRIYRQRWSVYIDAVEGYPRGDNPCHLYGVYDCVFQRRSVALESFGGICLSDCGGVFRVYEINSLSASPSE